MGRNAEKRKARKLHEGAGPSSEATSAPDAPAVNQAEASDAKAPSTANAPADRAGVRSLGGEVEIPDDIDGSMSRALFKVTCLLAVRDARGVPPENMAKVAAEVAGMIEADTVSILRIEHGDDVVPSRLVLLGAHGLADVDRGLVTFELGDGVAGQVALTGELLKIDDAPRDPRFRRLYGQRTEIGSLIAVPLVFGKRMFGVVTVSRREIRAFSPADEERLRFVASCIAQDMEQARLLFDAVTDPLTGLGTRLSLLLALPREVEIARRYHTDLSLIILDADGLQALNEAGGRRAGDRFLMAAARRLRDSLRGADLAVRLGADELALLLPMTTSNNARALVKRLLKALAEPVPGVDVPLPTWSIGVATLGLADEDALGLLWRCDEAVNGAKAAGGDRVVVAPTRRALLPDG